MNYQRPSSIALALRWAAGIRGAVLAAPWTLAISAAALLFAISPPTLLHLELAREPLAGGELWRVLTGHMTHFGANHLLWDVATFAALGFICESRWPRRTRLAMGISALAISLSVLALAPEFKVYRGLSGLDSALFGLLATSLLAGETGKRGLLTPVLWLLLAGFAAKVGYEMFTATTFFVDSTTAGFVPVPLAHAVGFLAGTSIAWTAASRPIGTWRTLSYDGR